MPEQKTALNGVIAKETMNRIIECIIDGKYSSACLILLEAAGYDPLHYIPYSTYNRLQKQLQTLNYQHTVFQTSARLNMNDLDYIESLPIEPLSKETSSIHGGTRYGSSIEYSSIECSDTGLALWQRELQKFVSIEQTLKMETL